MLCKFWYEKMTAEAEWIREQQMMLKYSNSPGSPQSSGRLSRGGRPERRAARCSGWSHKPPQSTCWLHKPSGWQRFQRSSMPWETGRKLVKIIIVHQRPHKYIFFFFKSCQVLAVLPQKPQILYQQISFPCSNHMQNFDFDSFPHFNHNNSKTTQTALKGFWKSEWEVTLSRQLVFEKSMNS